MACGFREYSPWGKDGWEPETAHVASVVWCGWEPEAAHTASVVWGGWEPEAAHVASVVWGGWEPKAAHTASVVWKKTWMLVLKFNFKTLVNEFQCFLF